MHRYFPLTCWILIIISGCTSYTPKPHGYPKVQFPEKEYKTFDNGCSYRFEVPKYAMVEIDTHESADPCWFNIRFPSFNATIYLSYKEVENEDHLNALAEDAYKLAMKNNIKADVIDEEEILIPETGNKGMIYELYGPSATPYNFYITDEKTHYVRGSFYFDKHTKTDSVAPIFEFLKEDIVRLMKSIQWASSDV
jgi:gliding motility-associated lipoprotein GldD